MKAWHYTKLHSKDNAAARRRRICAYVEEADDAANKVSQIMRLGIIIYFGRGCIRQPR
jgi:hypothetical protein